MRWLVVLVPLHQSRKRSIQTKDSVKPEAIAHHHQLSKSLVATSSLSFGYRHFDRKSCSLIQRAGYRYAGSNAVQMSHRQPQTNAGTSYFRSEIRVENFVYVLFLNAAASIAK